MARKKVASQKEVTLTKAKWVGFCNVYLSKQEKEQIKKEEFTESWYFDFIQGLADAGYKLSVSYSELGKFYTASVTGQYQERPNAGVCMSLKHRELAVALTALWWCLEQAGLKEDWNVTYAVADGLDW